MNKKEFYIEKEKSYAPVDQEAILRYNRAIELSKIKNDSTLLDIGCKYAFLRDILLEKSIKSDYYGVDITDKVFDKIKDFDPHKFFVADASQSLPFEDGKFDFIFALEILEHVESPTKMLQEIYRVLKPDGILILSVPNPYAWNEILVNFKKQKDSEGHISAFTWQIMQRLLEFVNFKIDDISGTFVRVPLSKRFMKDSYKILKTNNMFLTRSYIFKAKKIIG